jgi:hypothetical protein
MIPDDCQAIIKRMEGELNEYILANQELARLAERRETEILRLKDRVRTLEAGFRTGRRMVKEAISYLNSAADVLLFLPSDLTEAQPVTIDATMAAALDKATGEVRPA